MIVSGGVNIYPAEIEAVMVDHPKIEALAVIGVPDEKWSESVKAVIRLKLDEEAAEKEIIEWSRGKMAGYRVRRSVAFVPDVPGTAAGKVQKKALREQYWENAGRKV